SYAVFASTAAVAEIMMAGHQGRRAAFRVDGGEYDPVGQTSVPHLLDNGFDRDGLEMYEEILEDLAQRLRVRKDMVAVEVKAAQEDFDLLRSIGQEPKHSPYYVLVSHDSSWRQTTKLLEDKVPNLSLVHMMPDPNKEELDRVILALINRYVRGQHG
ncbi:MAG: hypothetical protein AAF449_17685, partial [Myxococcota bacterium]